MRCSRTLYFLTVSVLLFSGCSYLNREIPNLNLPEPDISTTAAGAASGATVGAGLGLVLGSMSGNAGEGLVVGSVAGATTGGFIGRGLERQEERLAAKRDELSIQRGVLQEQGREIQYLKQGAEDVPVADIISKKDYYSSSSLGRDSSFFKDSDFNDVSSVKKLSVTEVLLARNVSSSRFARGSHNNRFIAKPFIVKSNSSDSLKNKRLASQVRARMTPTPLASKSFSSIVSKHQPSVKKSVKKEVSTPKTPKLLSDIENTDSFITLDSISSVAMSKDKEEKEEVELVVDKKSAIKVNSALDEVSNTIGREEALDEVMGVIPSSDTDVAEAKLPREQCLDAAKEAEKARLAPSKSNRLFYYRRAMRLCPEEPEFHLEVGYIYASLGRNDDAKFEFSRVVELDPENIEAREQLSLLEH